MRYDAVIFDLDGTLTDSGAGIMNCARYALERMGVPYEESVLARFVGPPLHASFARYFGMDEAACDRAVALYRERYMPVGWKENAVYGGIRALLKMLRRAGAYIAIATGKPQRPTEMILEHFALAQYFDKVVGISEDTRHADKAALISAALPARCERAVMVGDRDMDVLGARAAGIDSIGVAYGYAPAGELENARPTHWANSVVELTALLCPGKTPPRGCFITVEGLDGCGKTTQAEALAGALRRMGFTVRRTREPGGCPISEKIRSLVLSPENTGMCAVTEALLYAAARAQHVHEVIAPALARGETVLCDRFVDSSVTYQGGGRGLGIELIQQINAPAVAGCTPDVTLYLRMDHLAALRRRASASRLDRIEQETAAFHARVEQAYDTLCARNPGRFVAVAADAPAEQIAAAAFAGVWARMRDGGFA